MKDIVKNALKTCLTFALIGTVVGAAAPFLLSAIMGAETVGALGAVTGIGVLHTALIFSVFGFMEPVVKPLLNFIFGGDKPEPAADAGADKTRADDKQVKITILQSPQVEQETSHFRQSLDAEKLLVLTGEKTVGF